MSVGHSGKVCQQQGPAAQVFTIHKQGSCPSLFQRKLGGQKIAWVHIVYLRWLTSRYVQRYTRSSSCRFIWSATWRSLEGQIGYLPADRGKPINFKITCGSRSKLIHRLFLDSWQEFSWLVLVEVYHLWIILKAYLENWSLWVILRWPLFSYAC